jgi:2'-5' RNA ligase
MGSALAPADGPVVLTGTTGVIVPVPVADPLLERVGASRPEAVRSGVPAHITVLFPFVPAGQLTEEDLLGLRSVFAALPPIDVEFTRFDRFPELLYLAPRPDEPFRSLTEAVMARWPGRQPYGGVHGDPVPHLTVASNVGDDVLAAIETDCADLVPLRSQLTEGWLVEFDGLRWTVRESFPFRAWSE